MNYLLLNNEMMNKINGFYQLGKDLEAVREFEHDINQKMMHFETYLDRMNWLIENGYYIDFYALYSKNQIEDVANLVYSKNFQFQSFMAISKFYQSYALKTFDGKTYLESYEDRIIAVALTLAQGHPALAQQFAKVMIEQTYQPATPTFLNAGRKQAGEMISCFLLEMDDTLNSINYVLNTCSQLSKIGGGVAVNLSKLRGRGEAIKGIENAASGVLPVMKLMEDTFNYVNQLGQRPGAGVAYLNIFHWDIEEFLDTKKINASEKARIQTLSIGLIVPDQFMKLAKENKSMYVFAPYSVYLETGKHLDDLNMTEWYDVLAGNKNIKKREINPRKLLTHIAKMQFESGYPYMVFKDSANKANALKTLGQIKISNLCTEIFQIQETSIIHDFGEVSEIKRDISCNLGSINIAKAMDLNAIKESVFVGMDALTAVSDMSHIKNAPGILKANQELHAVGLGVMNLHGYFAKAGIRYESEEAKEFARVFFMMINYYSLQRSMEIAKERKETFVGFEVSEYATGEYFDRYFPLLEYTVSEKVAKLFENMDIPTLKEWQILKEHVKRFGLYHAYRLAIAPTQSIAYIQNATPSINPIVDLIERRTYGDSTTYYPMPYLSEDNIFYYKSAFHMNMFKVIDLISEIQQHIDQGISMTLFVDSNTTTRELARYYIYAHHKNLKALYYTRTKNLDFSECVTCSV